MALRTFTNTRYFSEAAIAFKRDGVYCKAPRGHPDYIAYWKEQKRRCKEGYTVGDLSITGRHYWYLNFCPIKITKAKEGGGGDITKEAPIDTRKIQAIQPKDLAFPRFWEIDYSWWWAKEIGLHGMYAEDVARLQIEGLPIKDYLTGKHLACVKTRRGGFSYKEAADGTYNYNFIPASISYYFAAKDEYLTKDGILNKVSTMLDHLNKNTGEYWYRNRQRHNTLMHQEACYLDKKRQPHGFLSQIMGVIINDPEKIRGKDGIKGTFEEAGSFKNLLKAFEIAAPSYKDGDIMTGQLSVFGTGGEEGPSIEGLEEIFTIPDAYDVLAFNNIWEEGMEATECGFYVPCTSTYSSFMDEDGNIDKVGATEYDDKEREKKRKLKDPKKLDLRIAEYSRTPSEALQRVSSNIFPVSEISPWLKQLLINPSLTSELRNGILYPDKDGIIRFEPKPELKPIIAFPHNQDDDLTGCVTIMDPPICDRFGKAIDGLYDVVVDPYYKDQATDLTSLWSVKVIMHKTKDHPYGDKVVAWFTGRPASLETCYRITYYLSEFYNCRIQSEIAGGGQGLFDWLKRHQKLHKAHFEPNQFNTKEVDPKNRNYFMNLSTEEKINGITYLSEWLMKPRGITPGGNIIYNLHTIKDIGWLRELVKYRGQNADRISSGIVAMYMFREEEAVIARQPARQSDFYNRTAFGRELPTVNEYISLDDDLL
jgi:hypothetical protein